MTEDMWCETVDREYDLYRGELEERAALRSYRPDLPHLRICAGDLEALLDTLKRNRILYRGSREESCGVIVETPHLLHAGGIVILNDRVECRINIVAPYKPGDYWYLDVTPKIDLEYGKGE